MNTPKSFFYGFLLIIGLLAPWVWATGIVALILDYIVKYLASGREEEIKKLIEQQIQPLKTTIDELKNEIAHIKK